MSLCLDNRGLCVDILFPCQRTTTIVSMSTNHGEKEGWGMGGRTEEER